MEGSVEDLRAMDTRLISFSTDGVLTNGGFVFSSDAENGLTSDDGIPTTTYVTLPFQFLQEHSILEGGPFTVLLDASHLSMVGEASNQVEMTAEGVLEDGDSQLILDTGENNTSQVLENDQETAHTLGLDMTTMELTTLGGGDHVISLQDEDGNIIEEQANSLLFPSEPSIYHLPPSPTKRGPGRPRRDESEVVAPPVGKGPYKCAICNAEYPQWSQLRRHSKFHSDDKPYRCHSCPASFNVEYNLTLHLATHNPAGHCCPQCNKKFSRVASLKAHVILHMKEENLFCSECGDEFATQAQVDDHKKEHQAEWVKNVKVHACRLCHRQFPRSSAFREHMKEHYKVKASLTHKVHKRNIDRSSFSHKCDACHKCFQKPSQLVRHRRIHTGERPFKCPQCSKAFNQKGSLQIHLCKHSGIRPFGCEFCAATFSQRGNLRAHIVRVHTIPLSGEQVFKCMDCPCVFKKLGSLNSHLSRAHCGDRQQKLSEDCARQMDVEAVMAQLAGLEGDKAKGSAKDIVEKAMVSSGIEGDGDQENLEMGLRDRKSIRGKEKDCPSVKTITLSDRAMDGSMRRYLIRTRIVNKIRWLQCTYCNKEFKKPSDLVRHMRIHLLERPYKCSSCFRAFTVKSSLTAHIRTHTGIKDHNCSICCKKFSTLSSLKVHLRIHTGTKPFECHICGRTFRTSGHCKSHVAITHNSSGTRTATKSSLDEARMNSKAILPEVQLRDPILITEAGPMQLPRKLQVVNGPERPYKCSACSVSFRKSSHLMQHQRKHTGERPFVCPTCDGRFVSNGVLKAHLRTHEGLKPFSCTMCSHSFSTNGSLKRHLATHSESRPFMCPYCNKTFKSSVNTRKHMKTHKSELAMQVFEQSLRNESEANTLVMQTNSTQEPMSEAHFTSPDFAQAFSDQPFHVVSSEQMDQEEHTFVQNSLVPSLISNNLEMTNSTANPSVITHTLHADASGMITLPSLGQNALTQENISELERTLNEQIFGNSVVEDTNPPDDGDNSDVGSTTTEDLTHALTSEPREMSMNSSQQIVDSKNDQSANMFEAMEFESCVFPSITMQGDVMALDGTTLTTSMASILPAQPPSAACDRIQDLDDEQAREEEEAVIVPIHARSHVCAECNRAFKKLSHLKSHCLTHTAEKSIECEHCDKKYSSLTALRAHQKTHTKEKDFVCPVCACQFTTNGSLIRHMEVHSTKRPFKCSICSLWFRTAMQLRKHIKLHAPREREGRVVAQDAVITPLRGRRRAAIIRLSAEETETLARQSLLDANSVSEEVLIASAAETNRVSELKDPEEQHQWEPLFPNQCKYCPKSFRKPSDLVRHVRIHTGERPYQCSSCNKCFTVKSTLDSHVKTHSGAKCFTCHVCDCRFSTKGSLKVHMRLHTGAKPFKCPICQQMFRTSGHRKAHLMVHIKEANKTASDPHRRAAVNRIIRLAATQSQTSNEEPQEMLLLSRGHVASQLDKDAAHSQADADEPQDVLLLSDRAAVERFNKLEEQDQHGEEEEESEEQLDHSHIEGLNTELEPSSQVVFDSQSLGGLMPYSITTDSYTNNSSNFIANGDDGNLIALTDSVQFAGFDSSGAMLATTQPLLQNDENIMQQLQGSHVVMHSSTADNEEGKEVLVYNAVDVNGASGGSVHFQIITDKFGTILNIQSSQEDNSNENIMPFPNEISNVEVEESELEEQSTLFQVKDSLKGGRSLVAANKSTKKKKKMKDRDDDFLVFHDCEDCSKRFEKPSQLERHRRIHTGERPFGCSVCDKAFNQKNALLTHMKSHTGERPHRCNKCNYSSTQKGNLLTHMRRAHFLGTNSKETSAPFQCSVCSKTFSKKFSLTAHLKSHTNNASLQSTTTEYSTTDNFDVDNQIMRQRLGITGSLSSKRESLDQSFIKVEPSTLMDSDIIVKTLDLDSVGDLFPQIRNSDDSHIVLTLQ